VNSIVEAGVVAALASVVSASLTGLITFKVTNRGVTASKELAREERLQLGRGEPYVAVIRFTDCAASSRRSFSSRERNREYLGT